MDGMTIAALRPVTRAFALGVAMTCSGCLVTEEITFPVEENVAPAIVESMPPENRVVNVDPEASTSVSFAITVRDLNVEQRLIAKTYIDRATGGTGFVGAKEVLVTGDEERLLDVSIETAPLAPGPACRRFEVLVSAAFDELIPDAPVETNDLATGIWWLNVRSPEGIGASLDTCQ